MVGALCAVLGLVALAAILGWYVAGAEHISDSEPPWAGEWQPASDAEEEVQP